LIKKIYDVFLKLLGKANWSGIYRIVTGRNYGLTWEQHLAITKILSTKNCIIVTWRATNLSSYFVAFAHFFLTLRWERASHVLMNIEQIETFDQDQFSFIEAIGKGVIKSKFYDVFNCERAVLLEPRYAVDWDNVVDRAITNLNKEYDRYFNLADGSKMSCVEIVLDALKSEPDYDDKLHGIVAMIKNSGNLTPAMFLESGSFKVLLDVDSTWR